MYDFSSARRGEFSSRRARIGRSGKARFDDDEPTMAKRVRRRSLPPIEAFDATYGLPEGDRWSTWDQSIPTERGPRPHPDWLVTELAAVDTELGILKTGKEADVFLLRRGVPEGRSCLLAAKRYRDAGHRMFHRDSGYLEGRRVRESRINRAVASRSAFGKQAIAGQWAHAEFTALARLYAAGLPVPYPVQVLDTELLLEFIGSPDGTAAPRLAETRPGPAELAGLWDQLVRALVGLARDGLAHGDLSAYNLLVHDGRLVMIDLPQVVDVVANPRGDFYLTRDAENVGRWFTAHGLAGVWPEPADLLALLHREALLLGAGRRSARFRADRHPGQPDRDRLGAGVGRPGDQGQVVVSRRDQGQVELGLARPGQSHRIPRVPARSIPALDPGDCLQPRTRRRAADGEDHTDRRGELGARAGGQLAARNHVRPAGRVDNRRAVDAQLSLARGRWRRDRGRSGFRDRLPGWLFRGLGLSAGGLAQLAAHPIADGRGVPAGPDLHGPFGLDLGPFRFDAALPGVVLDALAEDDHEGRRRLPFRGVRRGQLAPGIVLPARYLLAGGARPQAGHRPVDGLRVGLDEAAEVGDVLPG